MFAETGIISWMYSHLILAKKTLAETPSLQYLFPPTQFCVRLLLEVAMKPSSRLLQFSLLIMFVGISLASCMPHRQPTEPRVAPQKLEQAKALKAPFGDTKSASPDIVAEGKRLFDRKSCVHCHGPGGKGDGAAASKLTHHPPRDFSDCKWHEKRTDGEIYWVLDHGVPGTGMVDQVPHHLSEAQAWKVAAYLRTLCTFK